MDGWSAGQPAQASQTATQTPIPPATAPVLRLQIWIIVYGQMQSWTPQLILGPLKQAPPNKWVAALWCGILTVVPLSLGIVMLAGGGLACQRCLPASARWPALHACMPAGCALFVPCLHHTAVPLMETSLPCLPGLPGLPGLPLTCRYLWAGGARSACCRGHHGGALRLLPRLCRQLCCPLLPHCGVCQRRQGTRRCGQWGSSSRLALGLAMPGLAGGSSSVQRTRGQLPAKGAVAYCHITQLTECPTAPPCADCPDGGRLLRFKCRGQAGGHACLRCALLPVRLLGGQLLQAMHALMRSITPQPTTACRRAVQLRGQHDSGRLWHLPDGVGAIRRHLHRCRPLPA